ncbi:MAG: hypothetical protein ACRBBP_07320 [Bdellovibrionales bacterium]
MAKKVFGSFLIMLFSILIILFFKTGAYKSVEAVKADSPRLKLYYKENIGPYHEIVAKIKEVEDIFNEYQIPCTKTFGHFLSDPEIIEHDKLVSHVGCAFYEAEGPEFFTLPDGIEEKFFGFDSKDKVCYNGVFRGSPSLSAIKVYPKLLKMAQKDRVKLSSNSLEIYLVEGKKVTTDVYLCEE